MKKIVVGSDHGGYDYKEIIKNHLQDKGYEVIDVGAYSKDSIDYPDVAKKAADIITADKIPGILVCGTGIGIGIAANKCDGIIAALANDVYSAQMSREHNDANVLTLGQRVIGEGLMLAIVDKWLETPFLGDRHTKRVEKIRKLEEK